MDPNVKIPLPAYLKLLTASNVPMPKAMSVAAKIYKHYSTPAKLMLLSEVKLTAAGVDDKDDRKAIMNAMRKAGYGVERPPKTLDLAVLEHSAESSISSSLTSVQTLITPPKKKRKRQADVNEFLPDGPPDEATGLGSLEFNEVLDEEILKTKTTVVNRAPLMTAWAAVVAECIGFRREEALSIATVYTEMNAISKGVFLGIFDKGKQKNMEISTGVSQPYVDLMGRRPLYQTQSSQWRALSNGIPVQPSLAFSYISRAFRQTTPHILGALRLLAESFSPAEVNGKAWGLYAAFRPEVDGWGKRSEVSCVTILGLRKKGKAITSTQPQVEDVIKFDSSVKDDVEDKSKHKSLTLEEYEATLDEDPTFRDVNLHFESN